MTNKDSNITLEKNRAITPEIVQEAFDNLPHNYVKQTLIVLNQWKEKGFIDKSYSDRYIQKVRKNEGGAYNKDVMQAIIAVGLESKEEKESFGIPNKKTSQTN